MLSGARVQCNSPNACCVRPVFLSALSLRYEFLCCVWGQGEREKSIHRNTTIWKYLTYACGFSYFLRVPGWNEDHNLSCEYPEEREAKTCKQKHLTTSSICV